MLYCPKGPRDINKQRIVIPYLRKFRICGGALIFVFFSDRGYVSLVHDLTYHPTNGEGDHICLLIAYSNWGDNIMSHPYAI